MIADNYNHVDDVDDDEHSEVVTHTYLDQFQCTGIPSNKIDYDYFVHPKSITEIQYWSKLFWHISYDTSDYPMLV